ncbi:MAG: hypothetical protein Phog2KO_11530 [Phototrophicaceae bacterium]
MMPRHKLWLALILIIYLISASLFIITVPIFEASDEAEHFIHIHTILDTGALPIIQSREQMANQDDPILRWNNQSHHAPLYYLFSSALVSWSERGDIADYLHPNELIFLRNTVEDNPNKWLHPYQAPSSDTHIAVYLLRVVNMLVGMGSLLMVYLSAKQVSDNPLLARLSMLLVASIPTFIVVNTSVTNDALVIFLYSAGIYWILKALQKQTFSLRDIGIISLILSGIALTKLTGVTLFGVVYLGLFIGILRQYWTWQKVAQAIVITGVTAIILAGWWYLRNLHIYGDLLAIDATASIWGRETPLTLAMFPDELLRIGKSFWMLVGYLHYPVYAPDAFYIYTTIITILGFIGLAVSFRRINTTLLIVMFFACFVVVAMLLYGTLSVDISYGRLLLPAISAFAPLLVIGWLKIFRRFALLMILPLTITSLLIPILVIPNAYPSLDRFETIPDSAIPVNWQTDTLEILAIDVPIGVVNTGDSILVDLYFRGNHPANPALTITAVDTIRVDRFDHLEIYPGMANMRTLPEEQIFRSSVRLDMPEPSEIRAPRIVNILVEWVDLVSNESLVFDNALSLLEVPSVTFVDTRYQTPELGNPLVVNFGDEITLEDYALPDSALAGETIPLAFVWDAGEDLATDNEAILTIQLYDADGNFIAQEDGALWWYPTTHWAENTPFEDTRSFQLPDNLDTGEYQIRIGWYRVIDETFPRLSIIDSDSIDNLFSLPIRLSIEAD